MAAAGVESVCRRKVLISFSIEKFARTFLDLSWKNSEPWQRTISVDGRIATRQHVATLVLLLL